MRISLAILSTIAGVATLVALADPLPPDASYRPLPTLPLDVVRRNDEAAKPQSCSVSRICSASAMTLRIARCRA